MQLGIFAKTFDGSEPEHILRQAATAGYDVVQYNMACSGIGSLPTEISDQVASAVASAAAATGIAIAAVSATYNMVHPDVGERVRGRDAFSAIASQARTMGTNIVTLCTGTLDATDQWRHHDDNDTDRAWSEMLREFQILLPVAEQYDLILGVEPELANVVSSARKARTLIDTLRSDRVKIILDPANLFETEASRPSRDIIADAIHLLGDSIALAHAKDRMPDGKFTTAGTGVIDFGNYLAALRDVGFSGAVVTHGLAASEAPGSHSSFERRSKRAPRMFPVKGAMLNVVDTNNDKIPFVFQHGLGGDAGQTAEVFPDGVGYRRITLECRAHGKSEAGPVSAFSLDQFSHDLGLFIESTLPTPVCIGGISMGAALSLMLAVRRPQLVKSLVIARPAWLLGAAPQNMQPNAYVGELLSAGNPVTAIETFNRSAIAETLERIAPDNLVTLRSFFERPKREIVGTLLRRISLDGPRLIVDDLRGLTIPVLVIGTDDDYVHPFSHAEALAEMIPGAVLVRITSKSASRHTYVSDFKKALVRFLESTAT